MKRALFVVLVPVKPPAVGKSRLRQVDASDRARLAACFALDTVAACLETPSVAAVLAVTDDAHFASRLAASGCDVLPDGVAGDLNESLRLAAAEATRRWPGLVPAAVCADLPALRPADLGAALAGWTGSPCFVSDAEGAGTTLYAASADSFRPCFGPRSRASHLAAGAIELGGDLPSLRRDVDDLAALEEARRLGVGAHTADLLAELVTP